MRHRIGRNPIMKNIIGRWIFWSDSIIEKNDERGSVKMSFETLSESANIFLSLVKNTVSFQKDHTTLRQEYTSDNDFSIDFFLWLREQSALCDLIDDQIFDAIHDWRRQQVTFDKRSEYFCISILEKTYRRSWTRVKDDKHGSKWRSVETNHRKGHVVLVECIRIRTATFSIVIFNIQKVAFRGFSYSTSWKLGQSNWIQGFEDSVLINKSKSIIVNEKTERRMISSPVWKNLITMTTSHKSFIRISMWQSVE